MRRLLTLFIATLLIAAPAHALYDAAPDASLAAAQGEWRGSLTYRDYRNPERQETLPTRLFVALGAADELVLHYVFDDGPGKTVHSYERMQLDGKTGQVLWRTGADLAAQTVSSIVSDQQERGIRRVVFERQRDHGRDRYTLELGADSLRLQTEELPAQGAALLRNSYQFSRRAP